jgi:glutaredoxin
MSSQVIKVYATDWCGDCYRAKYFLDQKHIPYHWSDIAKSERAKKFVMEQNQGKIIVPTIIFQDGTMLIEPSTDELIDKLGLEK